MSDRSLKYSGSAFAFKKGTLLILVASTLALSTGCLPKDDAPCEPTPYEKIISPISYKNGHDVYFNVNDFEFLSDSAVVIHDISLEGVMSSKHKESDDYSFDLNGTKISRADGQRNLGWNCGNLKYDGTAQSRFCTKLHQFSLNGGASIVTFMSLVKIQKGNLRLSLHAQSDKLLEARIVVRGSQKSSCENPPPPPPTPEAPITKISAYEPSASPSSVTTKSISFAADQVGVQYFCSLDGATASVCTSPALFSNLSNGAHSFSVYATNSAGLSDAQPAALAWSVDSVPPSVEFTNQGYLPYLTSANSITFEFTSDEAATYSCVVDGSLPAPCVSPLSLSNLGEGTHNVSVSAVDGVGNVSPNPASHVWSIDASAPVTSINVVSPVAAINNSTEVSIQFSANESASFYCSVDNGPFSYCQSPFVISSVSEGSHWFSVRGTDVAGNQGLPVTYSWRADFTAPTVLLLSAIPAAGISNAHSANVDFSVSETAEILCSFDGAEPTACSAPFSAEFERAGAHSLVISATDLAGNAATPLQLDWNLDFSKPAISLGAILPSSATFLNANNISLEVLATEAVNLTASVNGSAAETVYSPLVLSDLAEGAYSITINGTDLSGNAAESITYNFFVDLSAPQLSLQAAISGLTKSDSNELTFSANETANFSCNIDEAGFGPCVSVLSLSGLADGEHIVQVQGTDLAGNVSQASSVQWTVDTVPPLTQVSTTQDDLNAFTFALSASEPGSTLKCSFNGQPLQACDSSVSVSGLGLGTYIFFAQATDPAGNVDGSGTLVSVTVYPPTTSASALHNSRSSVTFTLSSNAPNATFTCSIDGAPAAACTSPYTVSGFELGDHTLVAFARDAVGNVDPVGATVTVNVLAPIATTLISQSPSVPFTSQKSITFNFSASHTNATFLCTLSGGAAVPCASPATFSGLTDGLKTFKVQAVDQWGAADPVGASYSWTVDTTPATVVTISTSSTTTTIDITWTTNEPTTTKLFWGMSPDVSKVVAENSSFTTSHNVRLTGLSPNTLYTVKPAGTDRAGNIFIGGTFSARTSR